MYFWVFIYCFRSSNSFLLWQRLSDCQATQKCHRSFSSRSKQPGKNQRSRNKGLPSTFCCCSWFLRFLDTFYCHINIRIWFSSVHSFCCTVNLSVNVVVLLVDESSNLQRHEQSHAEGVLEYNAIQKGLKECRKNQEIFVICITNKCNGSCEHRVN